MEGWLNGWMDVRMDGRAGGWVGGLIDGWVDHFTRMCWCLRVYKMCASIPYLTLCQNCFIFFVAYDADIFLPFCQPFIYGCEKD